MTACLFTEHFKPIVDICFPEKKFSFKISLLIDKEPGHPRALMEMYSEMNAVFMPPNTASILQPMDQGVILTCKYYYLKSIFCKAIVAKDSDSSDGSGQSQLKTSWKGFTILDAIKNMHDSWEEDKLSNVNRNLEKVDSNHHG